ncbi:MAG: peroxiredoxin [Alphaproteobacteria bacterium]|jgi:peroxiredoxin (alkyl hydroperoxide reductase subunit C)|nr:peroxiredoxin [Alphaproteobacteria bacterium]
MTIKVGDKVPSGTLYRIGAEGPEAVSTNDYFGGRKVVVFGLPGAFTPTCSGQHVPGYLASADAIADKGVDAIACISVNDAFVMGAWGVDQGVGDKIDMLADGSGELTGKLGLEFDLTERGLGVRSRRYAMIVEDGEVTHMALEDGPGLAVSSAEETLKAL